MERNTQSGNVALIVIGAILLLAGIAAFVIVGMGMVNYAEEGTAHKIGGAACCVGALALVAGVMMRKKNG